MLILIAGKQAALRNALKLLLQTRPGLEIVGAVSNRAELLSQVEADSPDLLLLDEGLTVKLIVDVIVPLQQIDPPPAIMILGSRMERGQAYLDAGANAFVNKSDPPKSLLTAIEEIRLQRNHE